MIGAEFWSSAAFHLVLALLASVPLIVWDWRIALPSLLLVQVGVGLVMANVYGLPSPWATVHFVVLLLACLILVLSILQTNVVRAGRSGQFSSTLFRLLILGAAGALVWNAGREIALPLLNENTSLLFLWLVVLAVFVLGLTEDVLFGGIGLLLWLLPVQALLSVLFPIPALISLLGILEILVAFVCSYLLLAEDEALLPEDLALTDPGRLPTWGRRQGISAGVVILWHDISYWLASRSRRRPDTR